MSNVSYNCRYERTVLTNIRTHVTLGSVSRFQRFKNITLNIILTQFCLFVS